MRVGIITMVSDNYGNRLQNYALQEVLLEIGNNVETLNIPWKDKDTSLFVKVLDTLKHIVFYFLKRPKRYERRIKFEKFNKKYIVFSKYWLNYSNDRKRAASEYDLFICGSDQIWNSEASELDGRYFANFASIDKRASYAASFGVDYIIEERKNEFAEYLKKMKYISVREKKGKDIIHDLIGVNVDVHLDPTLLLSDEKWDKVAKTVDIQCKEYALVYFLGNLSEQLNKQIRNFVDKNHMELIMLCPGVVSAYNNIGPDDFVSLIRNANIVFTDSFHGTVFSIIYKKEFYSFNRNGVNSGMASRILCLLELLQIDGRFGIIDFEKEESKGIDYDIVDKILDNEREKSFEYLKKITQQ